MIYFSRVGPTPTVLLYVVRAFFARFGSSSTSSTKCTTQIPERKRGHGERRLSKFDFYQNFENMKNVCGLEGNGIKNKI